MIEGSFRTRRLKVYELGVQTLTNILAKVELLNKGRLHVGDAEVKHLEVETEKALLCLQELFLDSLAHQYQKYSYEGLCEYVHNLETEPEEHITAVPIDKQEAKVTLERLFKTLRGHKT